MKKIIPFLIILLLLSTVSAGYITATGKPSAANTGLPYIDFTSTFINHCPLCGAHDCLLINPKGVPEGELTCKYCDSDWCIASGKEKEFRPVSLTKLNQSDINLLRIQKQIKNGSRIINIELKTI